MNEIFIALLLCSMITATAPNASAQTIGREPFPSFTVIHSMPGQIQRAKISRLQKTPVQQGLFELKKNKKTGSLTSPPIIALYPFNELIASANGHVPVGSELSVDVKILTQKGKWSRWYRMGKFSATGGESKPDQEDKLAKVDVDILKIKNSALAFQYRVNFERTKKSESPILRLVAITYTAETSPTTYRFNEPFTGEAIDIEVPQRSQMTESSDIARDICSPTSLAMSLEHLGINLTTRETSFGVRDRQSQLFGNWFTNTAFAGQYGFDSLTTRLNSLGQLEKFVRMGHPVIISLGFGENELPGAPLNKTRGHLLVVRGFDTQGQIIVNDPAAPSSETVRRVYPREPFARAWLENKKGLAYIIQPRLPQEMIVHVPLTSLRQNPNVPCQKDPTRDPCEESQLIAAERVRALKTEGDWVYVEALEQKRWNADQQWHFYPGWIKSDDLAPAAFWPKADIVVTQKQTLIHRLPLKKTKKSKPAEYSLGSQLPALTLDEPLKNQRKIKKLLKTNSPVLTPNFEPALISTEAVKNISPDPEKSRQFILDCARKFLGDPYFWGGRSGLSQNENCGIDCSGLVSLSYRCAGIEIPRNSRDQFLYATPTEASNLKPGDLIFLSDPGEPQKITHVLIYSGNSMAIEASGDANTVREIALSERLGQPWNEIKTATLNNGRSIYFGSF